MYNNSAQTILIIISLTLALMSLFASFEPSDEAELMVQGCAYMSFITLIMGVLMVNTFQLVKALFKFPFYLIGLVLWITTVAWMDADSWKDYFEHIGDYCKWWWAQ